MKPGTYGPRPPAAQCTGAASGAPTEGGDHMDQETNRDSVIILALIAAFVIIVVVAMALDARGDAGTLVQDDRGMVLDQPDRTVMLTDEEYQQFRQIVKIGRAPALQVATVTGAAVGMVILLAGLAYILFLVLMRYVFNRWFDQDVYGKTWPSTLVICVMIFGAVTVLAAAVMR